MAPFCVCMIGVKGDLSRPNALKKLKMRRGRARRRHHYLSYRIGIPHFAAYEPSGIPLPLIAGFSLYSYEPKKTWRVRTACTTRSQLFRSMPGESNQLGVSRSNRPPA